MKEPSSGPTDKQREVVGDRPLQRQRARNQVQQRTGEIDDRPAGGDHHDHEHECGLGEVAAFQIVQGMARAAVRHQEHQQHHGPEAEYDLDLAQQVPQSRMVGLGMGQRAGSSAC